MASKRPVDEASVDDGDEDDSIGPMPVPEQPEKKQKGVFNLSNRKDYVV